MTETQPIDNPAAAEGRGRMLAIGGAMLVAIVVGTFVLLRVFGGGSAAEVTLRSLGSSGDDPFTESVAPAPSARLSDFAENGFPADSAAAPDAGEGGATLSQYRTVSASVPGVFGGSLNETTCDKDQLVAFLTSEPDKAVAWAGVLAMDIDNIAGYVDGLTGVNLGADTRVLDHGFSDGKLVARQAVLQRGTAVLVDGRGVPRVDCYSGNPLRQPTVDADETFIGTPWTTFDRTDVVVIADAQQDVDEFELVSVDDGTSFVRPAGSTGGADLAAGVAAQDDVEAEPTATPVPTTPTPVPVTRDLTVAGAIELNDPGQAEIGSEQSELIYTFDAPAGARLVVQIDNDRASVAGVGIEVRSVGDRLEFFRVSPGATETYELSLSAEDAGQYEMIVTEGPAAFDFVVQATSQDDAGQGVDAGGDFGTALEIAGGQTVTGHLADLDGTDVYVIDVTGAPTLVFTSSVERESAAAAGFEFRLGGERVDFFRVQPAAEDTFDLRFGAGDELLEIYLTEGAADYEFTAELIPQQDGGQSGDAPGDLVDARTLTDLDFTGEVGQRDTADYYLFEAPADEFTVTIDVTAASPQAVGVELAGPDGNRIDFFRVQPGASGDVEVTGVEGETFRLVFTEGRGDYEVSIS